MRKCGCTEVGEELWGNTVIRRLGITALKSITFNTLMHCQACVDAAASGPVSTLACALYFTSLTSPQFITTLTLSPGSAIAAAPLFSPVQPANFPPCFSLQGCVDAPTGLRHRAQPDLPGGLHLCHVGLLPGGVVAGPPVLLTGPYVLLKHQRVSELLPGVENIRLQAAKAALWPLICLHRGPTVRLP